MSRRWLPVFIAPWALPGLWSRIAGALLAGCCGVSIGFHLFFPDAALTGWLQRQAQRQLPSGAELNLRHAALAFPLRLVLDDVVVRNDRAGWPELGCERLSLQPTWSTLIGSPGVSFSGYGPLGDLSGFVRRDGELALDLQGGTLQLPLPQQLRLDGELNTLQLSGRLPLDPQSQLQLRAQLDNLLLHGAARFGLADDALALGQLQLQVEGAGRSLQLRQLQLAGGIAELEGKGELLLQPRWPASRIDLTVQLKLNSYDPALRGLLELAGPPAADGRYLWQLRGPLSAPTLN